MADLYTEQRPSLLLVYHAAAGFCRPRSLPSFEEGMTGVTSRSPAELTEWGYR